MPLDYSKSIIYKLCSTDLNVKEIYVGSTLDFTCRKSNHKYYCNNPNLKAYNYKVYQFIRANGGFDRWRGHPASTHQEMIEVEKFSCNTRQELLARERFHVESLNATLNQRIPGRLKQESSKIWRGNNDLKIKSHNKQKFNCDCGGKYTMINKARHMNSLVHSKYLTSQTDQIVSAALTPCS